MDALCGLSMQVCSKSYLTGLVKRRPQSRNLIDGLSEVPNVYHFPSAGSVQERRYRQRNTGCHVCQKQAR
jgi:hypothetical protein